MKNRVALLWVEKECLFTFFFFWLKIGRVLKLKTMRGEKSRGVDVLLVGKVFVVV